MLNGRAVESERRWNNCLTAMSVLRNRQLACARTGDRASAKSIAMTLCAHFLIPRSQQMVWSP